MIKKRKFYWITYSEKIQKYIIPWTWHRSDVEYVQKYAPKALPRNCWRWTADSQMTSATLNHARRVVIPKDFKDHE